MTIPRLVTFAYRPKPGKEIVLSPNCATTCTCCAPKASPRIARLS